MKFRFLALLALVLGLASCQKDTYGLDVDANGEAAVTISVALPEVETRAGGNDSAIGAFGNVDFTNYDVRYILEVYNLDGSLEGELAKERIVNTEDEAKETSFTLRLIPGRGYRFVVWADLVLEDTEDDLHYVTTDLKDIQFTNLLWKLSDETRDAYTGICDEATFNSTSNIRIELKRPLGKLRVVTTDIKDMFNVLPEDIKVVYSSQIYTSFDAYASKVIANSKQTINDEKSIKITENKYTNEWEVVDGVDKVKENLTLFADYYFAANEQEPISFTLDVKDNNGMTIPQVVFSTPIPIQRNYLTTVMGPVLTDANSITVVVNDAFANLPQDDPGKWNPEDDEYDVTVWDGKTLSAPKYNATEDVYEISTGSQLAYFAAAINGTLPSTLTRAEAVDYKAETMVLTGDVDLGNNAWTPIGLNADSSAKFSGVFEGNGFKITNLKVDTEDGYTAAGLFGATNGTLRNFTVENASISHVITSSNGASSNGIAVVAGSLYSKGTIEGVNVKNAVINGNRYIGGIAGYVYGNVKNCSVEDIEIVAVPNVYKNGYDNGDKVGGVAGYYCNESVFIFSGNTVKNFNIRGYRDIGGVVGSDQYGTTKNCRAENGTLTIDQNTNYYGDKTPNAGFVVGRIVNGPTLDASNTSAKIEVFYIGGSSIVNHALKTNTETINIEMTADATVAIGANEAKYYFGGADTKAINIVGNDKVLTFDHTNGDWNYIRLNNDNAKWNIKNVKLTNSGKNNGPWNRHDIRFYNDVTLENATSDKAIALLADADLTNVVISDVHPSNSEAYALWITAEGQTVNLTNCQLLAHESKSGDRGIKIDNEYVDTEAKVTLNVDGLKVKSQKKAAIMVKSTAGADITLKNVDITEVEVDKVNAVWVDEATKQYANLVSVSGGSMVVEGVAPIEGETTEDVQTALNAAVTTENAVVQLPAGEYTFPKNFAKGVTVICEEGTVFNGKSSLNINGATVVGATFQSGSDDLVAYYSTINGTYKNCVFNGDLKFSSAGDTVVFENCVFNGPDYALHFDSAVANSHVILKGCEVNSEWRVAIGAAVSMFEAIDTKFTVDGFINLWGKAKFTNCAFNKPYYWICSMDYTEYTNCTCEGRALVADDIDIDETVIKINDEFFTSTNEGLKIALEKNASVVNLLAGNYELSGLNFVANNVTLKGEDKANVVLNLENSIYLQNKSVTLENLTYNLNAGKGYTEQAFAFVHHATAFNLKNCNVNRLRLNVNEANIEDCTFTLDTSSGFDGYCIYYYGNNNSTVNVKNSTFATAGKGICIYSESAKAYNLNVDKCSFTSSDSATDKAAIQMHTELGISGNVRITETTATGFADINGGLWNELNNNTKVATDKFDIWVDGTQVH